MLSTAELLPRSLDPEGGSESPSPGLGAAHTAKPTCTYSMLAAVRRAALVPPAFGCCERVLDTWEVATVGACQMP